MDARHARLAAALVFGTALVPSTAVPRSGPVTLTPDQQLVVAAVVEDTFRFPRRRPAHVLCLDVQLAEAALAPEPAPEPPRGRGRKRARAAEPEPPAIWGAPPE